MDVRALGASQISDSVTAQFYLDKGKYVLEARACGPKRCEGKRESEHARAGERPPALWLLFVYAFSSPLRACPM